MTITGTLTENSDARLKTDLRPLSGALSSVRELRPVRYRLREAASESEAEQLGLVAQEVQQVLPELALQGSDGTWSVAYGRLSAVLVAAIQEQQRTMQQQEAAIEQLVARLERLERLEVELASSNY